MTALILGWASFDAILLVLVLRPWRTEDARRPLRWIGAAAALAWVLVEGARGYNGAIARGAWTAATLAIPYIALKGLVFSALAYATVAALTRALEAPTAPLVRRWGLSAVVSAVFVALMVTDIRAAITAAHLRRAEDTALDAAGIAEVTGRIESGVASADETHAFLSNGVCPPALLARFMDGSRDARIAVARNPALAADLAVQLSRDADQDVRMYAAHNPHLPTEEFPRLARDPYQYVREAMAWRKDLDEEDFARLVGDADARVRAAAALQPRIDTADLRRLATDSDTMVRSNATRKLGERGE